MVPYARPGPAAPGSRGTVLRCEPPHCVLHISLVRWRQCQTSRHRRRRRLCASTAAASCNTSPRSPSASTRRRSRFSVAPNAARWSGWSGSEATQHCAAREMKKRRLSWRAYELSLSHVRGQTSVSHFRSNRTNTGGLTFGFLRRRNANLFGAPLRQFLIFRSLLFKLRFSCRILFYGRQVLKLYRAVHIVQDQLHSFASPQRA
jgi:hypothetical protein